MGVRLRRLLPFAGALLALVGVAEAAEPDWERARERMVARIEQLTAGIAPGGKRELRPAVLKAMRTVPRHEFVPESLRDEAYEDRPLPIGYDVTISQPFIVALMTDLAEPEPDDVVLEVGTGSGYQAAVLSGLVARVYSIEIVAPLAEQSARRLQELGYRNVTVRQGDGYLGWPEHAPFDAIVVTAGAPHVPEPLVQQLKPGGRMVIPVGPTAATQELVVIEKRADGRTSRRVVLPVRFVPLLREGQR